MASLSSPDAIVDGVTVRLCAAPSTAFPTSATTTAEGFTDVLISVTPPATGTRPPTDVVCVVDVSGSMGVECTNGDSESQGLSVLDIVKHATKTVANCLTAQDRFSLVSYSTSATVVLPLTAMNAAGIATATAAVDGLREGGQTNLWDGLHSGLKVLSGPEGEEAGRMKAVLLLTDGQPNISPPRGHLKMLQQYKEETALVCTVSTFGFGYNLDSLLLRELALEGQGMYAFIPDGSFVGTAFVNATSNILSMAAREVTVKVSGLPEAAAAAAAVLGDVEGQHIKASWGLQIPVGSLHFGQTRDLVVSVPSALFGGDVRADVEFSESGSSEMRACFGELRDGGAAAPEVAVAALRLRTIDAVTGLWRAYLKSGEGMEAAKALLPLVAAHMSALVAAGNGESGLAGNALLVDLVKDVEGQLTEAMSRDDWFKKWGKHYVGSLLCAHSLQQCNNFKDPGIQHYGGPLFIALRDTAEQIFIKLPPPTPSQRPTYGGYGGGYGRHSSQGAAAAPAAAAPAAASVDMSAYYNQGGGCFAGGTAVELAGGGSKRVDEVAAGDAVKAFRVGAGGAVAWGIATVAAVVETVPDGGAVAVVRLRAPGSAAVTALTPWHPVLLVDGEEEGGGGGCGTWAFPAVLAAAAGEAAPSALAPAESVFNLALEPAVEEGGPWHGVALDGGACLAITLGHGIASDPVASHAYYGTRAVLDDIASLPMSATGKVVVSASVHAAAAAAAVAAAATAAPDRTKAPACVPPAVEAISAAV